MRKQSSLPRYCRDSKWPRRTIVGCGNSPYPIGQKTKSRIGQERIPPSGAWFPLEVAGETFSAIGHLLPTAWAMDGFQNLIVRGLSFQSILMPVGILSLYTLIFFGLAVWRFDS